MQDSGLNGEGLNTGCYHCVVFLGKSNNSHSVSLHHPGVLHYLNLTQLLHKPLHAYSSQLHKDLFLVDQQDSEY